MARLVARALRLGRSALIQAGAPSGDHGRYRLGYLMPALIWQDSLILVVSEALQQRLLRVEIPRLRQWVSTPKAICRGDRWTSPDFQGLMLTSPQSWLGDRLTQQGRFPEHIPTIIDGVDDLETWVREQLTVRIEARDWDDLMLARSEQADVIRDMRVQLTRSVFQHPVNPYNCYLIEQSEQEILNNLYRLLQDPRSEHSMQSTPISITHYLPDRWANFWHHLQDENQLVWVEVTRLQGQFSLHCSPIDVAATASQIWEKQPVVLIGGALDLEPSAPFYRQRLGLEDITCLKFAPDRQNELIQLYLPDRFPLPNTPQFQGALLRELRTLLSACAESQGLTVLLIGDVPLKAQIGSVLASEFGSRVQVEKTCLDDQGILVTGWEFWRQHQSALPAPQLLVIATLPIPSLEDPLVAGRVAYYKRRRQDWFRLYLLPETLSHLQRAVAPVRETQGVVALLDNRVNYRSYGQQVLSALSPMARINYVDSSLFRQLDYSVLD
jgi:ATP-dependent DNA helicase DinG